jgi:hypothetical protein
MGYYIQCPEPKNKSRQIMEMLDGIEISTEEAEMIIKEQLGAVICVGYNGPFEAAAYIYNLTEFRQFNRPEDNRPKTWIVVNDIDEVHRLTNYQR